MQVDALDDYHPLEGALAREDWAYAAELLTTDSSASPFPVRMLNDESDLKRLERVMPKGWTLFHAGNWVHADPPEGVREEIVVDRLFTGE